jgi:hypothetical protein
VGCAEDESSRRCEKDASVGLGDGQEESRHCCSWMQEDWFFVNPLRLTYRPEVVVPLPPRPLPPSAHAPCAILSGGVAHPRSISVIQKVDCGFD